ncbi:MAG: SGNH/GDSL hydrolase family protein [Streptosporangiales bacterium]|nr:SGNH/GDSL hydrolase family protein [Streptosporangiales bacterium]
MIMMVGLAGCLSPQEQAEPPKSQERRTPVVMFLGDSYSVGVKPVTASTSYAAETARILRWQVIIGGEGGTGLVSPGRHGNTFSLLFDEHLSWRPTPDMVIISGGHNDFPYPPSLVGMATRQLIQKVAARWPTVKIVLIGPIWGGDPIPEMLPIRDAMQAVAQELRVPFVDPLAEQWFTGKKAKNTGNASRFILKDGVHPTELGHRYMADRLASDLRKLGLADPTGAVAQPSPKPGGN